MELTGCIKK